MPRNIYIRTYGGLGDVVLLTPVFKELKRQFAGVKVVVLCSTGAHYEVLRRNPYIDALYILTPLIKLRYTFLKAFRLIKINDVQYAALHPSFTYSIKASEIIARMVGITLKDSNAQIYLDEEEDNNALTMLSKFKNPVVINITSIATNNQMWPVEYWNELVKRVPACAFIQLGLPNETRIEGAIDMRGKTGIRESMAIVKHARGFIGVVSFLSHATNAFNQRGVVLFGPSAVAVWGHANNVNVSKNLPCSNCIDWLKRRPCPYDKPCMRLISVEEIVDAIYTRFDLKNEPSKEISDLINKKSETFI